MLTIHHLGQEPPASAVLSCPAGSVMLSILSTRMFAETPAIQSPLQLPSSRPDVCRQEPTQRSSEWTQKWRYCIQVFGKREIHLSKTDTDFNSHPTMQLIIMVIII